MTEPTSKTPAGRELDLLIAEKVLGLPVALLHTQQGGKHLMYGGQMAHIAECPRYSTDIAAAFQIVDNLGRERNWTLDLKVYGYGRTYAWFDHIGQDWASEGNGEHATAHAICLAALAALNADDARSKALGELARQDVADGSYDTAYTGEE